VLDQIGIHVRGASNIIIRNLHIKNVKKSGSPTSNGGDAIGMESSVNNVWIDHNTLEASGGESDGYDSLLDMKSGVTNVTVSWNHFRNSSRAGLIGSSDSDSGNTYITFHNNWYENIEQRTPLLRHGLAHTFNNYWSNIANSDMIHGINSRMGGRILVEGNYFKNSNNPLLASDDSDEPGCWQTRSNTLDSISYDRSVGSGALVIPVISGGQFDSTCSVSVPYSYTLASSTNVPGIVTNGAGVGKINP
jgi:pectate lyase